MDIQIIKLVVLGKRENRRLGRILVQTPDGGGYLRVRLSEERKRKNNLSS